MEALAHGAVDAIGKDGLTRPAAMSNLCQRLFEAAQARITPRAARPEPLDHSRYQWGGKLVLLGASTGGVEALEQLLGRLPPNAPPVVVVQHMPPAFLQSLARRMAGLIAPRVTLARDGMALEPGLVCFAPGGPQHLELRPALGCRSWHWCPARPRPGHRPAVDRLFRSALPLAEDVIAGLLTGMGRDGAAGMLALRRAGARTLAQDEHSSTIWGMPRAAWEGGAAEAQLSLPQMAEEMLRLSGRLDPP